MKITLHFFLKDLRASRAWWLVTLVLAVAFVAVPVRGEAMTGWLWNRVSFWLGWLLCLAVVLLQNRLINLDPPEGSDRFIGTRPVSGWRIISGKAGVLCLLGLLPLSVALGARMLRLGLEAAASQVLGILAVDLCLLVLALGMICLPYATSKGGPWTGLAAMLFAFLVFIFGNGLMFIPFALDALPAIVGFGIIATGLMGAMLGRYVRLSGWRKGAGIMLAALLGGWMSYGSFGPLIQPEVPPVTSSADLTLKADRPQQLLDKAAKTVSNLSLYLRADRGSVTTLEHAGHDIEFRQHLQLRGLPEGVYADFESSGGFFQVAGQGEWRALRRGRAGPDWAVHPDAAFYAVPGNPKPTSEVLLTGQTFYLPLGRATVPELRRDQTVPITLKGEAIFSLYRVRLEKVLRVEEGTVWTADQLRLAFSRVNRSPGKVQFQVEVDIFGASSHDRRHSLHQGLFDHGFFGLQGGTGKPARLNCLRGWDESHPLLRHERFLEQASFSIQDRWWNFPSGTGADVTSSRDGQLGIFRREVFATVSVPFEFENADIKLK